MKKLRTSSRYFINAMLAAVLFSGCKNESENNQHPIDQSKNVVEQPMNNSDYSVVIIDSCEYVVFDRNNFSYNSHSSGITHKGNCRFCSARQHSR